MPIKSPEELIWSDRQYIKNNIVSGKNKINSFFGQFTFNRENSSKIEKKYEEAFKKSIAPP
jgi:hypothetical protein